MFSHPSVRVSASEARKDQCLNRERDGERERVVSRTYKRDKFLSSLNASGSICCYKALVKSQAEHIKDSNNLCSW